MIRLPAGQRGLLGAAAISAIDVCAVFFLVAASSSPEGPIRGCRPFETPLDSPEAPRKGWSSKESCSGGDAPLRELPRRAPRDVGDLAPFRIATAIHASSLKEGFRSCRQVSFSKESLFVCIVEACWKKGKRIHSVQSQMREQKRPLMLSRASTRASDEASRTVGMHTSPSHKYGCRGMPLPGWSGGAEPLQKIVVREILLPGVFEGAGPLGFSAFTATSARRVHQRQPLHPAPRP